MLFFRWLASVKQGVQSLPNPFAGRCRFSRGRVGQSELELLAEIGPGAVTHPFRIGNVALVMHGRSVVFAVPATVQIGVAFDAGFFETGLPLVAGLPVGVAFMAVSR